MLEARNLGETAIRGLRGQPSAEIVREVIFDLSGCKFNVSGFHLFRKHKDRNISIYSTCNFIPLPRDFNEVSGVYT